MSTHVPTHGVLTEPSVSDHPVTPDRKGREGKGVRKGRNPGEARIHRCSLYAPSSLPIGAASLSTTPTMDDRCAMFGGGC